MSRPEHKTQENVLTSVPVSIILGKITSQEGMAGREEFGFRAVKEAADLL